MEEGEAHKGWSGLLSVPGEPEGMLGQGLHARIVIRKTRGTSSKNVPFHTVRNPKLPRTTQ